MAFTKPYTIQYSSSQSVLLEFLHEIIKTPLAEDAYFFENRDGYRPFHSQDYCELIFFQSGSRDIRIGKTSHTFNAGDIMAVTPSELHSGRSHNCILDRYYIHISPNAFAHFKDKGKAIMGVFYNREKYTNNKITLPWPQQSRVQKLLRLIDTTIRFGNESTRDIEAYALIIEILGILNSHAQNQNNTRPHTNAFLLNILSFIENAYPEPDVMDNVMHNFGISRTSLWRMFKTELNTTPYVYLLKTRLESAKLLLDAGYDVTNAAAECGFADSSHFIKKFKEKYGVTPNTYKRSKNNQQYNKHLSR